MNKLKDVYVEANLKEMIANWKPGFVPTGDYIERIAEQVSVLRAGLIATEL